MDGVRTRIWPTVIGGLIWIAAVAIALSVAQPAQSADAGAPEDPPGSTAHATEDPAFQAQMAEAVAEAEAAEESRQAPEEIEARQRSRTAYQDLSSEQAQALAVEFFGELMLTPSWATYEPPPGREIDRYMGTGAVLLKPDQSASDSASATDPAAGSVVQSMTPIRARDESGALRPTDSRLVDDGDHVEPANAAVDLKLPRGLADGIELPEIGLTVTPDHAAQAGGLELVGADKAFYPSISTDTDFFAAPIENGVEAFWQLRSERSPEELSLDLDLPPGAELRPGFHGLGAEIVRGDQTLAAVEPPAAFDADHAQVPVAMRVDGSRVVLSIDHRAGDIKYPVLVDPAIPQLDVWTWNTPCPSLAGSGYPGWRWESVFGSWPYSGYPYLEPGCDSTWGLVTYFPAWNLYDGSWWGQWVWAPPANTYIQSAELYGGSLRFSHPNTVCRAVGIYTPAGGYWENVDHWCSYYDNFNEPVVNGGNSGLDNNVAIHTLYFPWTQYFEESGWTQLRGARFMVSDRHAPTVSVGTPGTPYAGESTWVDDSQAAAYHLPVSGTDLGLGLRRFYFSAPTGNQNHPIGCSDSDLWSNPCPLSANDGFNYQLPEGRHRVAVQTEDLVENLSTAAYGPWQRVDRSPPSLALTGSLKDSSGQTLTGASYDLAIAATDGSTSSPLTERSGVTSVEVKVDGQTKLYETQQCPGGSCRMDRNWVFRPVDYAEGPHAVTVTARDAIGGAGHETTSTINVVVGPRGDVYHATEYDARPSDGGRVITEVWRHIPTGRAREVTSDGTRALDRGACQAAALLGQCDFFTSRTEVAPGRPDAYARYESIRTPDPGLPPVGRNLDPAFTTKGTLAATGPLSAVLQSWQVPPPGYSTQYERYEGVTSGTDRIRIVTWVDSLTDMPIRVDYSNLSNTYTETRYWTYLDMLEAAELPSDFFRLSAPTGDGATERVERVGSGSLGLQLDIETGQPFMPYYLGDEVDLGVLGRYCLVETDRVRMTYDRSQLVRPDVGADPEFPGDDPDAPDTFTAANYTSLPAGQSCTARTRSDDTPDMSVLSSASSSTDAAGWLRTYREIGLAIEANLVNEDRSFGGLQLAEIGGQSTLGYVVRVDGDRTSSLFETAGGSQITIDAPVPKSAVPTLAQKLRELL